MSFTRIAGQRRTSARPLIRVGGYQPPDSLHTRAARQFCNDLEGADGARFDLVGNVIDLGHKTTDLLEMTEAGEIDICYFNATYLTDRAPNLGLLDLPFQATGREAILPCLDGWIGARLAAELAAASGFTVLGWWDNGVRHISCARGPLRHFKDCRGLRLRTLADATHQAAFRALGFEPVSIDARDLLAAVADGTVDAQENPLTNYAYFGLDAHHCHVTLTSHLFGASLLLANTAALSRWSDRLVARVRTAAAAATALQRRIAVEEESRLMEILCARGIAFHTVTDGARKGFRTCIAEAVKPRLSAIDADLLAAWQEATGTL